MKILIDGFVMHSAPMIEKNTNSIAFIRERICRAFLGRGEAGIIAISFTQHVGC
jgi:hypothetical protein